MKLLSVEWDQSSVWPAEGAVSDYQPHSETKSSLSNNEASE